MNVKKILQNEVVEAERRTEEARSISPDNKSLILIREKLAIEAWLRLIGYGLKEKYGLYIEPLMEVLNVPNNPSR